MSKVTKLQVIVAEDGEVIINPNKLGLYVDEKEVKEIVRKEIKSKVKEVDVEDILDSNLDDMIAEFVEDKLDKKLGKGSELETLISDTTTSVTLEWIQNNIDSIMLEEIIKESMINKLKELSFEQLKEIINGIKGA